MPRTRRFSAGAASTAIQRAAGQRLREECRRFGGCKAGDAELTRGHRLPARFVIHAVGPVWRGGGHSEPELLASCYRRSLAIAGELECRSIAFPCISTGVYGYPIDLAARVAVGTARDAFPAASTLEEVVFCCFSRDDLEVYESLLVPR
jgi:O-acetyl-ADP-ribose deacetylase (regulator of RNase III)